MSEGTAGKWHGAALRSRFFNICHRDIAGVGKRGAFIVSKQRRNTVKLNSPDVKTFLLSHRERRVRRCALFKYLVFLKRRGRIVDVAGPETPAPAPPEDVLPSRSSPRVSPGQLGLLSIKLFLKLLSAAGETVKEEAGKRSFC